MGKAVRLDQLVTHDALALTVGRWSRPKIETVIEHLIELLDGQDASVVDLEPECLEDTEG